MMTATLASARRENRATASAAQRSGAPGARLPRHSAQQSTGRPPAARELRPFNAEPQERNDEKGGQKKRRRRQEIRLRRIFVARSDERRAREHGEHERRDEVKRAGDDGFEGDHLFRGSDRKAPH